ncbi:hypothetical protein D3C84_1103160 [compost metagenome]
MHPPLVIILFQDKQIHEVRILPKLSDLLDLLRGIPSLDCESLQRLLLIRLPQCWNNPIRRSARPTILIVAPSFKSLRFRLVHCDLHRVQELFPHVRGKQPLSCMHEEAA